ncbi:hypothetical protein G6F46_001279 [Rhizopus delemar]|nr:hypothetical protein G6F54_004210 [Rhizopus delemar]KAG1513729.1 hypothetical protein G6F53_004212 [Rhizopus delemar]KAG1605117.1 hypothetical protein G6F47_000301 [Rhizopus delemar]KAG1621883.1 hypothetical protein G6F46_001279 [Rhizopus delemar]
MENEVCERKNHCSCIYHKNVEISEENSGTNIEDHALRKPGLLHSGHYAGETSFCAHLNLSDDCALVVEEDNFPAPYVVPVPSLTLNDQLYLIDVYYDHINAFFPLINKNDMISQLHAFRRHTPLYLSPFFFYALFARAASFIETQKSEHNTSFYQISRECMNYAAYLRPFYQDRPRISTILALVIMAQHIEQTKLHEHLTQTWLWSGEAFRSALDLGIHRSTVSSEQDSHGQLDVPAPSNLSHDDGFVKQWLDAFTTSISLCKIAARVIRFNYSPPPPFNIPGPIKRHNAFLASVDSWLTDIMYPSTSRDDSPQKQGTLTNKRLEFEKEIFLLVNLILLHRPYINDTVKSNNRPSYDIFSYAAILITDAAYRLDTNELIHYHAKSPIIAYALITALRVHIINASTPNWADKFNADKNYNNSVETICKLPQLTQYSLLNDSLQDLQEKYRKCKTNMSTAPPPVFIPKKRKLAMNGMTMVPTIKQYQHDNKKTRKGKKKEQTIEEERVVEEEEHFIPNEFQLNMDPYQQFYNQLLYDIDYNLFDNNTVQEYNVGLEDNLGVSIQLVSNKPQQ